VVLSGDIAMPKVFGLQKSSTFESADLFDGLPRQVSSRSVLWRIPRQTLRPKGCRERLTGLGGQELEAADGERRDLHSI
jgi:hypothetical protein